jgi:polar amino acid transport system ATP-binding protein
LASLNRYSARSKGYRGIGENEHEPEEEPGKADPELIGEVLAVMKDLALESGTTMVVVTHEMGFARDVADRMAFIHEGSLIEEGPPAEIVDGAKDPRTRRFLEAVL